MKSCDICQKKADEGFVHVCNPNFKWSIGENFHFQFNTKKTLYNRMKWFVATKLFLPGTYKWLK